jgi:ubiquinol-cytochrome c reductase cytochrome b subunit
MGGIPHDHYEPKSKIEKAIDSRLPIVGLLYDTIMVPTPKNLNWMWIWGIVLTFCLTLQIITGIVLVMHYTPHVWCVSIFYCCLCPHVSWALLRQL